MYENISNSWGFIAAISQIRIINFIYFLQDRTAICDTKHNTQISVKVAYGLSKTSIIVE